ncbi:MAG: TolB family protein [Planctomycetota bacterium]|jgi:hypothetical protein
MITKKNIEQYLKDVPRPSAPDSLLEKLQADVSVRENQARQSVLRRSFAPAGQISLRRIAAGIVIAILVLLPLSYGATKLIKRFITISQLSVIEPNFIYGAALSPDGKHFAGATMNSQLVVIDTSTGEQRNLADDCDGPVVWSAGGNEIAVRSYRNEKPILVAVRLRTGKCEP